MNWLRFACASAGSCCVLACGEPPDPPGPVTPARANGPAAAGSGGQVTVFEALPMVSPTPVGPPAANLPDAAPVVDGSAPAEPVRSERSFTACTDEGGTSCDYIYVTMQEASTGLCVQLTLDNCGADQRPGLPIDVPLSWRLAAGSVGDATVECLPGNYDPRTVPVTTASGSISWNDEGAQPSELVIDVTIEPSRAPPGLDASSITLVTREFVAALPECDD